MRFQADEGAYFRQRDFALNLAAFLARQRRHGALLALLEAGNALNGATSDLLAALEDYPPLQYAALLRDAHRLEEVAPYLVNLEKPAWAAGGAPLTGFADWLFAQEDFARLGVFFVSSAPFLEVKTFWQRFSYARFQNNEQAYFRFYNPRFFNSLIKNLGKKEYLNISSVAELIFYFDYFKPNLVHIYHFYAEGYRIEQYDLEKANAAALIETLFSA